MDDLISRQAAIDALWKALFEYEDKTEKQFMETDELDVEDWVQHRVFVQNMSDSDRQTILELPSADVQPRKTAEWIYGEKDGADGWYCSKCGFHIPWYYEYYGLNNINFIKDFHTCPHCDAKMLKYTGMDGDTDG